MTLLSVTRDLTGVAVARILIPVTITLSAARSGELLRLPWRHALIATVLLGLLGTACLPSTATEISTVTELRAQLAEYYGLAWLPSGELVVGRAVDMGEGLPQEDHLATVNADGSLTDVAFRTDEACWRERFFSPQALPDGRLGFLHVCMHAANNNPRDDAEIRAIDLSAGSVERLFPIGKIGTSQNLPFTIGPGMDEAIVGLGGGVCASLAVFATDGKSRRFSAIIEGDGKRFNLDEESHEIGCTDTGMAWSPTLSPDAAALAFFASPGAVGATVRERQKASANVYLLDLETNKVTTVLSGVGKAGEVTWSPDGKVLAFLGEFDGQDHGLWLTDAKGNVTRIGGPAHRFAWSPDSKSLFVSVLAGDYDHPFMASLRLVATEAGSIE